MCDYLRFLFIKMRVLILFYFEEGFIVTNKFNLSTHAMLDEAFRYYYDF